MERPTSNTSTIGWLWVGGQVIVLAAVAFVPRRSDWPTPGWLEAIATALVFCGLALVVAAALGLGRALTPTPVPTSSSTLETGGFYRHVRHPIYTGVLVAVLGVTLRSASWIHVGLAVATLVFFDRKSQWEEAQLVERYPDYPSYASVTPKFVPRPWRRRSLMS